METKEKVVMSERGFWITMLVIVAFMVGYSWGDKECEYTEAEVVSAYELGYNR